MLYGTTSAGGGSGVGTVFKLNTDGTGFAVLKHFTGSDGQYPQAGLTLAGNVLYGTTLYGGGLGFGTIFKIDLPDPVFLTIQRLGNAVRLSWTNPAFALQTAPSVTGVYTNIPGATSPHTNDLSGAQKFYRLMGN